MIGAGTPSERRADAIVHHPTLQRMLRAYGSDGGWDIAFYEDDEATSRERTERKVLFVDSLHELAVLASLGVSYRRTYLIGRDDDVLADQAEDYGVTALLTCPDHWFGPSCP